MEALGEILFPCLFQFLEAIQFRVTHVGISAQSFTSCVIVGGCIPQKLNRFAYTMECVLVTQSCLILSDPIDCNLPGSSVHGILQARILEWVTISFSKGHSPTQGLNLGLLHFRQILYCLIYQGSPI